jgi:hypothetical protein
MDLKNAVAVCLISLFSATLVVLIARALDLGAASRIEPQLAKIAEELQAIRKSGAVAAVPDGQTEGDPVKDGLVVYYFHGKIRCPTCRSIESQSHETVQSDFTSQLESGEIAWEVLNYEEPGGVELAKKLGVDKPVVVLVRMRGGQIEDWKRLDRVWALVGDKPAFAKFVREEISRMLEPPAAGPAAAPSGEAPEIPVPGSPPPDIPVPSLPGNNPTGQ